MKGIYSGPKPTDHQQSSRQDMMFTHFCKPQLRPGLVFVPNVAYHLHVKCLLATFHISRWKGRWWRYNKPTRLTAVWVTDWIFLRTPGYISSLLCGQKMRLFLATKTCISFQTPTKWILCLNLSSAWTQQDRNRIFNITKHLYWRLGCQPTIKWTRAKHNLLGEVIIYQNW